MMEVQSHLTSRLVFASRHLAPLPKDLEEKQKDAIDFVLNAPEKSVGEGRKRDADGWKESARNTHAQPCCEG